MKRLTDRLFAKVSGAAGDVALGAGASLGAAAAFTPQLKELAVSSLDRKGPVDRIIQALHTRKKLKLGVHASREEQDAVFQDLLKREGRLLELRKKVQGVSLPSKGARVGAGALAALLTAGGLSSAFTD